MSYRSSSPASPRGRPSSPRPPPSYARSSLDRSPSTNPMVLDERPRVPPPIYLRSSSPQGHSGKGTLKIHIPAWGVALVRPPRNRELHPLEAGGVEREPPCEDTVLTGALEVIMKERRRVKAVSVGVQSVCRLHMGVQRGWEEDGIFERGVEVLAAEGEEGIWLEEGSQSFTFSLLLPATLATSDVHSFGRLSYIITARVEGITAASSFSSMFKAASPPALDPSIPNRSDFERVIARSDKLASAPSGSLGRSGGTGSRESLLGISGLSLEDNTAVGDDASAIAVGEGSPSVVGLYTTRRHSFDQNPSPRIPPLSLGPHTQSPEDERGSPLANVGSRPEISPTSSFGPSSPKTEKAGWMKGDLYASRPLMVHANDSHYGGVTSLDLRKEGFVDGLGTWRFAASGDVFSIGSVFLLSITCPSPSPACTIFLARLIITQSYSIVSPRTPNKPAHVPEGPKSNVIYQVGRPHRVGEKCPARDVESLWRGKGAGGNGCTDEGWKIRAVVRMPNHDKIRPTTCDGTITPIRVTHECILQIFYSVDGQCVKGTPMEGPGELRMMTMKMPAQIPSCVLTGNTLNLPTYETAHDTPREDIDAVLSSPPSKTRCMCGSTFAELGEAAMRKMQVVEQEEMEARLREGACGAGPSQDGSEGAEEGSKQFEARRAG
ncbi:hypothetical protein IAU60_004508 [Kwoniella sp. DSM 27419]